ncbi:MAG: VanW family protein [Parcubacteria group bacterium]
MSKKQKEKQKNKKTKKRSKKAILFIILISLLVVGNLVIFAQILLYNQKIANTLLPRPSIGQMSIPSEFVSLSVQQPFILHIGDNKLNIPTKERINWIESYLRDYTQQRELRPNTENIEAYLKDLVPGINSDPINGKFIMKDGDIHELVPAQNGKALNIEESVSNIASSMGVGITEAQLVIDEIAPEIDLEKLRGLGITTLLGVGESNFAGSSGARVHNITIGSEKINGVILDSGEEFSFNDAIGTINAATGYLPNLVIKGYKLVPEYGGGMCQVSTTLFRTAAETGLKITERHPHSLPVRFYNPQGYDATVYQGVVDLKFMNDTPSYILIQSKIADNKLFFEIYGKDDGRTVEVANPVIYEAPGDGSLKTYFSRTVTASGSEESEPEYFYSSYKAPYLFEEIRNPLE